MTDAAHHLALRAGSQVAGVKLGVAGRHIGNEATDTVKVTVLLMPPLPSLVGGINGYFISTVTMSLSGVTVTFSAIL